ncbi:hypothetical protein IAU59_000829 [Kwoniella sp. CBS 9459]
MTTTAGPSHQRHSPHPIAPSYGHYRHHPYAPPQTQTQKSASNSQARANGHSRSSPNGELPPSPPRSRRDASETPSIGLGVAFGGNNGGKWWDEELPPPPASLSSILDSFRKSGEGDRDLLLSILGAKKAEEERLTALIQTRLTILQARLSLHSAAASLSAIPMVQAPSSDRSPSDTAINGSAHGSPNAIHSSINGSMAPPPPVERTPSLTSSRGPGSTSDGIASPPLPNSATYMPPPYPAYEKEANNREREQRERERSEGRGYWQLPSLQSSLRPPPSQNASRSPNSPSHTGLPLAPLRDVRLDESSSRDRRPAGNGHGHGPRVNGRLDARSNGSVSPKSHVSDGSASGRRDRSGSGLEMLLDAGRVVNESSERDS